MVFLGSFSEPRLRKRKNQIRHTSAWQQACIAEQSCIHRTHQFLNGFPSSTPIRENQTNLLTSLRVSEFVKQMPDIPGAIGFYPPCLEFNRLTGRAHQLVTASLIRVWITTPRFGTQFGHPTCHQFPESSLHGRKDR